MRTLSPAPWLVNAGLIWGSVVGHLRFVDADALSGRNADLEDFDLGPLVTSPIQTAHQWPSTEALSRRAPLPVGSAQNMGVMRRVC